jgi:uncharacterized protein (TIGR03000 family)
MDVNAGKMPTEAPKDGIPEPPSGKKDASKDEKKDDAKTDKKPGEESTRYGADASTLLTVAVPDDARIYVNGKATTTPGNERQFVSRNLVPGYRYTYRIRAELERDGEVVTETKVVEVRAGEDAQVAFKLADRAADRVHVARKQPSAMHPTTKLTVRVPADARLYLAGKETKSTGSVRTFTTKVLEGDTAWEDYTVRAVTNVDGQSVTQEKTVTLRPGQSMDVSFDFDGPALATVGGQTAR